jgi:prepilin-type N-terminal cleavage/methylation domain-containing protein
VRNIGKTYIYRKRQFGFTLIELVIALGVAGIIMSAITATIYQMWTNSTRNTSHLMATKQIENSLHFMLRDVQMAQTIATTGTDFDSDEILRLIWISWDEENIRVSYYWSNTDKTLRRVASVDGSSTTVAYAIETQPIMSVVDGNLMVDLTCTIRGATEHRLVEIKPRTGS